MDSGKNPGVKGLEQPHFPGHIDRKMPEPISTALGVCCFGYAALNAYSRPGSTVSAEAVEVRQSARDLAQVGERSQALFGKKLTALSELWRLAIDCAEPDWDGAGSRPIDPDAVIKVEDFVRALPIGFPAPTFAAEPDGSVSLDWIISRSRLFSLSVGASDRLAFAWIDGTDKGHGVARFDGKTIPLKVLRGIEDIASNGHTPLWAT